MITPAPVKMADFVRNSVRRQRAIESLLAGMPLSATAASAGISVRTLRRWRSDPQFVAELRASRDECFADASAALTSLSKKAVSQMQRILDDENASDSLRLRAAIEVLDAATRISNVDVVTRIFALEKAAGLFR
jgi:hypothetical protein